jgi:hypothetical protein
MSETQIQNKIISIEKFILQIPELNVRGQIKSNKKKIDMRVSKRQECTDGFYLVTVEAGVKECHAILIYRETLPGLTEDAEKIIFYIFDPNGKTSAQAYGYESNIIFNKPFEIDYRMTPEKSINESGRCALWCIIVITLWSSFAPEERMIALSVFNSKMRSSKEAREKFMEAICCLLQLFRDFTKENTIRFIEQLKSQIINLEIKF